MGKIRKLLVLIFVMTFTPASASSQEVSTPQILRSWLSSGGGAFVIVADGNDSLADIWIKSPADGQAKMLRDLPVTDGRIRYTIPSGERSNSFWSQFQGDGLMAFVFRKNGTRYGNSPAILHRNQIGVWTEFYKRTQIQGHLAGNPTAFLGNVPELLTASNLSFPYRRRNPSGPEIPFVNKFSINRILGGYRPEWFPSTIDYRSQDIIYRDTDGVFRFRFNLLDQKIDLYLSHGYTPGDITLALENVPWDLAQATCHDGSDALGDFGNRAAPRNMSEWAFLIRQIALHLRAKYGENANLFRFKMGSEYNQIGSFCGSQDEFFRMYASAAREIKSVLPDADFLPGEFAGDVLTANVKYAELFDFTRRNTLPFEALPRSCHSFPFMLPRTTSQTAASCTDSFPLVYRSDASVTPATLPHEIHQFGTLGEQGLSSLGDYTDYGPRGAAWHFMTAIKLKKKIDFKWLSHWDLSTSLRGLNTPLISGTWWLYQVFEKLNGLYFQDLSVLSPISTSDKETYAVAFYNFGKLYVAVASFNPNILKGRTTADISVQLPRSVLPRFNPSFAVDPKRFSLSMVEIKNANSPGKLIRDLVATDTSLGLELKAPFSTNTDYLARPHQMIVSTDRTDLSRKLAALGAYIQNDASIRTKLESQTADLFKLKSANASLKIDDNRLVLTSLSMEPSHVRLIEITPMP